MTEYKRVMEALAAVDKALVSLIFMEGMDSVRSNLECIAIALQDELFAMEDADTPNLVRSTV